MRRELTEVGKVITHSQLAVPSLLPGRFAKRPPPCPTHFSINVTSTFQLAVLCTTHVNAFPLPYKHCNPSYWQIGSSEVTKKGNVVNSPLFSRGLAPTDTYVTNCVCFLLGKSWGRTRQNQQRRGKGFSFFSGIKLEGRKRSVKLSLVGADGFVLYLPVFSPTPAIFDTPIKCIH